MTECSVDGCAGVARKRGFCIRHYERFKRHGDPKLGSTNRGATELFLESAAGHLGDECLLWPFARNNKGYGKLGRFGKTLLAHIVVCEAVHGIRPEPTIQAAHSCGNGHLGCVSGAHLRWATSSENERDKVLHGTVVRGEKCHMAKLTKEEVEAIRAIGRSKLQRQIADQYGVSVGAISQILSGTNWKWLTPDGVVTKQTERAA